MKGSSQYHQPVLEALCAFVRNRTIGTAINERVAPANDIQAALTVIGRRNPGPGTVDLDNVRVPYAMLFKANLTGAILIHANLTGAFLKDADLNSAYLTANLTSAILNNAELNYADLTQANLTGADLTG